MGVGLVFEFVVSFVSFSEREDLRVGDGFVERVGVFKV